MYTAMQDISLEEYINTTKFFIHNTNEHIVIILAYQLYTARKEDSQRHCSCYDCVNFIVLLNIDLHINKSRNKDN